MAQNDDFETIPGPSCTVFPPDDPDAETIAETQFFWISQSPTTVSFALRGDWTILNISELENLVVRLGLDQLATHEVHFQCGGLHEFDLSGAWLLYRTAEDLKQRGFKTDFRGFKIEHLQFIEDVLAMEKPALIEHPQPRKPLLEWLAPLLRNSVGVVLVRLAWTLRVFAGLFAILRRPRRFRWRAVTRHIYDAGINASFIIVLMSFLVAIVLGYQGKSQLAQFGAQIYTIDLVAISILREMGALLTAILVAGRSGSAFAAEIGVMQLNEEIDAMGTMGIDPVETLMVPRLIALLVCLPLLTFAADIAGLIGTLVVSSVLMDIPPALAIERFIGLSPLQHFWVGMAKAPFFAIVIALIGTFRGFHVENSADAVGRNTTGAVVESVFMVMCVNAIFSILFTELGY